VLLASAVAWLAYQRRTLTLDGAVAATAVGALVFGRAGLPGAGALLAFFVSSSALSRLGLSRKALAQAKGARRDATQVLANGGAATVCAVAGWPGGLVGALAAAAADTWATEVGLLFGGTPRLLTTLERVEAGRSGGVSAQGLLASAGGALVVGFGWRACGGNAAGPRTAVVAGFSGAIADSLLGATVQALYRCRDCGRLLEAPHGHGAELLRGYRWVNNDVVNAVSTSAGAVVGAAMWRRHRTRRST
jgi:uncharacterized protein (TIGR00297 family)